MIWETGRPVRRNMGPNNARCIVWALGEFFFLFLHFIVYLGSKLWKKVATSPPHH